VAEPVALQLFEKYPTVDRLAAASVQDLETLLRPLGLFRKRARALRALAVELASRPAVRRVPDDEEGLRKLPYVGRYTANATLCFGYGQRRAIVDANVVRLFSRYFGLPRPTGKVESDERYWSLANAILPPANAAEFNWYLLDLGAMVCKPTNPRCAECPLARTCSSRAV
jgi:A/G-specific adenine glycosylase